MIDPATTSSSTRETLEFRLRALSKFDHPGAGERWQPWHSARLRLLRVKSHSSDRSTNTPDLSAGTPPVEIQSPFRVYSKCPTKIANDGAKIRAL